MKKNYRFFTLLAAASLALASCEKENFDRNLSKDNPSGAKPIDPSLIRWKPSTPQEVKLVENLGKVTVLFKELYKDRTNVKVVNASIISRTYTDESILLKDLIYPQGSLLATNPRFMALAQKHNLSLTAFANNFWTLAGKTNDFEFANFLATLKPGDPASANKSGNKGTVTTDADQVSVYFPYSQQFIPDVPYEDDGGGGGIIDYGPVTNLVSATADADAGWGYQQYTTSTGAIGYQEVLVDDEFVYNNPTHIVGVNGIEPYSEPNVNNTVAFEPTGPIPLPGAPRAIKQVYIGDVRCTNLKLDALISATGNGGGPEIRFTRADGFLKIADGQVQPDMWVSGKSTITRWHVRNKRFYAFNSEWDGDWEPSNLNENLAIFEEDNRNQLKISGSVVTTVKELSGNMVVGTIAFEKIFKSDDELQRQVNMNHASFFLLNREDREGESFGNWPVRDRYADVSYTLQDRTYIP